MTISEKSWTRFINILSKINSEAGMQIERYIEKYGISNEDRLIDFIYGVVNKYGDASGAVAAQMYDEIVILEGLEGRYLSAMLSDEPEFEEIASVIKYVLRTSHNTKNIAGTGSRYVKMRGQDTLLQNAIRDHAEWAWIPHGDTCPFCITLASNGWQPASKEILKGGHAEHIHANCDCSYAIRHSKDTKYDSYNPDKYLEMYEAAEGRSSKDKINYMRRQQYAENKDKINAQKREAYRLRQEAKNKEE